MNPHTARATVVNCESYPQWLDVAQKNQSSLIFLLSVVVWKIFADFSLSVTIFFGPENSPEEHSLKM